VPLGLPFCLDDMRVSTRPCREKQFSAKLDLRPVVASAGLAGFMRAWGQLRIDSGTYDLTWFLVKSGSHRLLDNVAS